jgi:hypothetical protein
MHPTLRLHVMMLMPQLKKTVPVLEVLFIFEKNQESS